ncbi:hypothetical protein I350_08399 [Cryptococcus amylolentus CBS 6273]|nr:hypothetical protein I350_08399 [Cryptococcus amylolentus CBS 6273]
MEGSKQLKRDWYAPIASVAGKSGRGFKDGKLQMSEEEWEGFISNNKRYKKLKEQPFHHFDAMKYILDNHIATGNLAGPIHSRLSNRSVSPDAPSSVPHSSFLQLNKGASGEAERLEKGAGDVLKRYDSRGCTSWRRNGGRAAL